MSFPPSSSNHTLCRIVADKLWGDWKQPLIVDNKAGADGNIGAEIVYGAPGDGYTLPCIPSGPLAIIFITAGENLPGGSAQDCIICARPTLAG